LEFVGESKAVKELGGVLVRILNSVEVQCLPSDLPHNIEVDISPLKTFSDSIHVKNLKVPAKVEILTQADETIVKVQPPRDVDKELAAEKPVEDVSAVEGAAETAPAGEQPANVETKKE
jgi:large subunit ribosomal protein L25